MLELAISDKKHFGFLNIKFEYKDLDKTFDLLAGNISNENEYYILMDEMDLEIWNKANLIKQKVKFIINGSYFSNTSSECLYLNNKGDISYNEDRKNFLKNINPKVKKYIIKNNIYLEQRLKYYLSAKRIKHVKSVKSLGLKIYRNNKESLARNDVVTACLLHDIAREYPLVKLKNIIKRHYPDKINEKGYILHQYVGEYIAKKKFYIEDRNILEAIKYHTTAEANISKLAKLVFVSDKLDPLRDYDTSSLTNKCIENLESGFIEVLKDKIEYSIKHDEIKTLSESTKRAISYYLKGDIKDVGIDY